MKKLLFGVAIGTLLVLGASQAAGADPLDNTSGLVWNDTAHTISVTVNGCDQRSGDCWWELYVQRPNGDIVIAQPTGQFTGQSFTLSANYPTGFCGVVQADVKVAATQAAMEAAVAQGGSYPSVFGFQHTIPSSDCAVPTTTPPSPTKTTVPPSTTPTTPTKTVPPATQGTTIPPSTPPSTPTASLPYVAANVASVAQVGPQLPFTGVSTDELSVLGGLGCGLLALSGLIFIPELRRKWKKAFNNANN